MLNNFCKQGRTAVAGKDSECSKEANHDQDRTAGGVFQGRPFRLYSVPHAPLDDGAWVTDHTSSAINAVALSPGSQKVLKHSVSDSYALFKYSVQQSTKERKADGLANRAFGSASFDQDAVAEFLASHGVELYAISKAYAAADDTEVRQQAVKVGSGKSKMASHPVVTALYIWSDGSRVFLRAKAVEFFGR